MRAAALGLLLFLAACAEPEAPQPQMLALDCAKPYAAQRAAIEAQPGVTRAPAENEPYAIWNGRSAAVSYIITEAGAPGHPAILMQRAQDGRSVTTGCAYGEDPAAYEQLLAYWSTLGER